jgi:sugar lactone lactonase YvrE
MPSLKSFALLPVAFALVLFAPQVLLAQYTISTVAGGGPNNLAALSASIGYPGSVALDSAGNIYIADSYSSHIFAVNTGTSAITIAKVVIQPGDMAIAAGNGTLGYSGDGGPAISAALNGPEGVFVDGSGNIFIADTQNSVIREVTATTGNISTVAGTGTAGYGGDGGPASGAGLYDPYGVFVDGSGNIFIADTDNCLIRKVSGGNISTVAGDYKLGCGYFGDGALATGAQLGVPEGVFADPAGNIFIADTDNSVIREVTIANGYIQTVVGVSYDFESNDICNYSGDGNPAADAQLCLPSGVYVDASEDMYIADWGNSVIREVVAGGNIETVAGDNALGAGYSGDGAAATSAQLNYPNGIFVDSSGDILIADNYNFVIREVTASNGYIETVIGNKFLAYSGDGGTAVNAELNYPGGVFVDGSDDIFIADSVSSVIREVVAATGGIQTVAGNATDCSAPTAVCGDGGLSASAQLNNPYGVFVDPNGNILIADTEDNRIRVVNTSTTAALTFWGITIPAGEIATVAGTGTQGYGGDGAAATSAELFSPYGVFVDSAENIFIADKGNHAIREVAAATGIITTVAGTPTMMCSDSTTPCGDGGPATSAKLSFPDAVFVDSSENIYIADTGDNRIRVVNTSAQPVTIAGVAIPTGDIATVAGSGTEGYLGDGAAATNAELAGPSAVFVDTTGDIFITDTANEVIREVVASAMPPWLIATVAGDNALGAGYSGDAGQSTSAQLNTPSALFGDSNGNLFVADTDNSRIRELVPTIVPPTAAPPPAQTTSPGGAATYSIQLTQDTGDPKYAITLSCLQSTLPPRATCSFSPATITPGPLPVPFKLTVNVPTSSASLEKQNETQYQKQSEKQNWKPNGTRPPLSFAFAPLAGILFAGIGLGNKRRCWFLLAGLCVFLILLSACGGSSSGSGSTGTTYNIQVQGTTTAKPNPVTITTVSLTVQ